MDRTTTTSSAPPEQQPDFLEFAAARGRHLIRTAFLLTGGDGYLAEDLVQETLARIYLRWRRIAALDNPAAYAQTALVNTFLSHRRRRSSTEHVTDRFAEVATAPEDPALRLTLLRALAELSAPDRAVLVLRYWEDRSVEETAAALRLGPTAVRSRSSRALARMRAALGDELGELAGS
ncbi:SigE family RNA polymerase sigma factor [Kitasatospora sp. NPDC048540]|uniref:SigE family RNA polymerase sigma factor n=1 Tax=unclassified Kitasatospora TaxID=2633591 RepID=UPI00053A3762|nr:SigE family RNA polymerase sigma factor [Kitasatospora sp. MBT63]